MLETDLPHNELVWWRMTKKQRYLPGRVITLELENKTVGIEEDHEKILKRLVKQGSIIIHSFDDMKYAVCSSSNVRLYPTFSEEEQKLLEKECMKSTKMNYRALLRIKKIVELRKLDHVQFEGNQANMTPLEIRMIQFFKDRDSIVNISESIEYLENNTAIELLGSIVNRKSLKTMISQSPQAYFYLDKTLMSEKSKLKDDGYQDIVAKSIESKQWQNELNEIVVNRKTICELLSCIPQELLSIEYSGKGNKELMEDYYDSITMSLCGRNHGKTNQCKFIIEYFKLSMLYLRILSKSIALRVVNANQRKHTRNKSISKYVIVLSLGFFYCEPYEFNMLPLIKLNENEVIHTGAINLQDTMHMKTNCGNSSRKATRKNIQLERSNSYFSLCFKTTIQDKESGSETCYKVDLNRISSQLVVSEELQSAYDYYNNEFTLKDIEHRAKLLHVIKASCPMMTKLLREWIMNISKGDFDHLSGIDQLKKIKENMLNVDR
ncbi:hypothetical protein OIY81_1590 [Cryptosporidium canis]|nr:hypothetical protein OIY81_1590 [Cryptosporidium canis]